HKDSRGRKDVHESESISSNFVFLVFVLFCESHHNRASDRLDVEWTIAGRNSGVFKRRRRKRKWTEICVENFDNTGVKIRRIKIVCAAGRSQCEALVDCSRRVIHLQYRVDRIDRRIPRRDCPAFSGKDETRSAKARRTIENSSRRGRVSAFAWRGWNVHDE